MLKRLDNIACKNLHFPNLLLDHCPLISLLDKHAGSYVEKFTQTLNSLAWKNLGSELKRMIRGFLLN